MHSVCTHKQISIWLFVEQFRNPLVTITKDALVSHAAAILVEKRLRRLVVVDTDAESVGNGPVCVGILSPSGLMHHVMATLDESTLSGSPFNKTVDELCLGSHPVISVCLVYFIFVEFVSRLRCNEF